MDDDDASSPQLDRPSQATILAQWTTFFSDPLLSLSHLKQKALAGEVSSRGLRSLHWRYFFSLLPSPSAPSSSTTSSYSLLLVRSRSEYSELRDRYLRSPDGGWVNDGATEAGSPRPGAARSGPSAVGVQVNNPLSLEESNPWKSWFEDLELRRMIRQDVQRTFPDIDYFRLNETHDRMVDQLFILAKLSPEIGYRQGMHELLAPILWTVDYDSLAPTSSLDSLPHLVLSSSYIEHDTWSLFAELTKAASPFYDFTPSVPLPVDRSSASTTSLTLHHHAPLGSPFSNTSTVLVQPIVGTAIRIHDGLLKTVDVALWARMEQLKVEPQLYAIRWLRLLFGREFPILDTLALWDGLFAADPSLRLMEDICIAMLLRIRDALLDSDYSGFLQLLLRYPAPSDGNHRIDLLLSQATFIRDNVSADAGERCRAQNVDERATAGVASGGHVDTDQRRRRGHGKTISASAGPGGMAGAAAAALLAEGGGIVGDIAKGVYGRAEALGINKAFFGTFNEIRRGVNAQAQPPRDGLSEIPSRPPWDVKPPRDYLAEMARLRASNAAMGKAVHLCVGVLERQWATEGAVKEGESSKGSMEGLMALTALKHVRDVLGGEAPTFDPNVLAPLLPSPSVPAANCPTIHTPTSTPTPPPPPPSKSPPPALPSPPTAPTPPTRPLATPPPAATPLPAFTTAQPPSYARNPTPTSFTPLPSRGTQPLPSLTRTPHAFPPPSSLPPSRTIPPWESNRLPPTTSPTLPRLPPSASTGRLPPSASTRSPAVDPTFPPTSFSTRPAVPSRGRGGGAGVVVVDPLGAMRSGGGSNAGW